MKTLAGSVHWIDIDTLWKELLLVFALGMGIRPHSAQAQPANDMFADRTALAGTNIFVTANSVGATRESGEPYPAEVWSGSSVWWSWTAPASGSVTISTSGSSFDTVLGLYAGSWLSWLDAVASNDDENYDAGIPTSKLSAVVEGGSTYQIVVAGYGEVNPLSGDINLSLQFGPFPPAPAWSLPDPNGVTVCSTNYAGKVVILDFWATWCSPCRAGMPDLVALQDTYRGDGLVVIGANVSWSDDTFADVLTFLANFTPTLNYPIVMSYGDTEEAFGNIDAVPTTFIIDRQNLIRKQFIGTQSRSTLETQIIPLLYCNTCLVSRQSGDQMELCWPTNALSFTLESATSAVDPVWSAWPASPSVVNGTNVVRAPMTDSARYFRLRMPY